MATRLKKYLNNAMAALNQAWLNLKKYSLVFWKKARVWYREYMEVYQRQNSFRKKIGRRKFILLGLNLILVVTIWIFVLSFGSVRVYGSWGVFETMLFVILPLAIPLLSLWWAIREVKMWKDMCILLESLHEISTVNLYAEVPIKPTSPFYEASQDMTHISTNLTASMERMMKSEKMKVDLVTNVSHDLKTPLTSIISYVDLLQKDDTLSEEARDYVTILAQKATRLKDMVQDLFDLAKSTSGNIKLEMEQLDISKLIMQTLIDMDDKIQSYGCDIRTKYPVEPAHIYADGKKLYRVFQNIISNALKYSLEGTRIYLEVNRYGNDIIVTLKNTASYEMNFDAESILERFVRGDESRTGEGSGLGLSIAKSFTENCGGTFKVVVDGDLFKTIITFPAA